jgi:DNA polymerase-4
MSTSIPINNQRKIIHVDMDAFYASVEQLDHPEWKGKPLAVGGESDRGVVAAASYEARKYGVRSAMNSRRARELCPHLIFAKPRFDRYKEISKIIRSIFLRYTLLVEPLSLDEAYLDVSDYPSATIVAEEIRAEINKQTKLTASAGISINKFLAKILSDWNKPNGQKTLSPKQIIPFLESLDVKKIPGVGNKTKLKMYHLGIYTGKDLKEQSIPFLIKNFGKAGKYYFNLVRGIQNSPVKPHRVAKSIGIERTFSSNLSSEFFLEEKLEELSENLDKRLKKNKVAGKTVTLKIKYSDFILQTRSKTLKFYVSTKELILEEAKTLLYDKKLLNSVRLIGISLSNLNSKKPRQTTIKEATETDQLTLPF